MSRVRFEKSGRKAVLTAILALVAGLASAPGFSQDGLDRPGYFEVRSASTRLVGGVHTLDARLQLVLSSEALDAPCSASGVIRRHPDIKHLRRASDIADLAALQAAMLEALWPLLATGGRLLYVTCSVLAAENDSVVSAFLARTPDAREDDVLQDYNIRDLMRDKACGHQVLPGTADMDGFYFAGLTKVS